MKNIFLILKNDLMKIQKNVIAMVVIMGITVMVAAVVLIGNLVVDLAYGLLDPRISYK